MVRARAQEQHSAPVLRVPSGVGPWQRVDVLPHADSTNAVALAEPQPWRVVATLDQRAGRGRLSRSWVTPPGAALAVSCVVPLPQDRPHDWGWLALLTGLAALRAVTSVTTVRSGLKWPNDVLVRDGASAGEGWAKVCGVLTELAVSGDRAVTGAGVNLTQGRDELPVASATSLRLAAGTPVSPDDLVRSYLGELGALVQAWQAGGAALEGARAAYRRVSLTLGRVVQIQLPDGAVRGGEAVSIDTAGRLVVRDATGLRAYAAGDVVHVRPATPGPGAPEGR